MSELLSRRDGLRVMAVGAGVLLGSIVAEALGTKEKTGKLELEGAIDDKGTLWVYQKGLPQAYKFGFGHQFRAVSNYDKNSDGSSEGIVSYEGMLGFTHGDKPGAEVDGFRAFPDPVHPESFLYFVEMPSYIIPGVYEAISDGNYDYWQVAKVELRLNPKTNQYEWTNLLEPGEPGYVNNLNSAGGPPYDVEGYKFVKESQHGGGVTIFEYTPANPEGK